MAYYTPYQSQYYSQLGQYAPAHQQTTQNAQSSLIWVQGIEAAKSYMVAPNTTVLLMDSESQRFYLKTSDASGMPMLRVCEYTETAQNGANKPVDSPAVDLSTYATKAEFEAFRDEIQNLLRNVPKQTTKKEEIVDA